MSKETPPDQNETEKKCPRCDEILEIRAGPLQFGSTEGLREKDIVVGPWWYCKKCERFYKQSSKTGKLYPI